VYFIWYIYGLGLFGIPKRFGKLKDLTKFDASFFGVHPKQANGMDPQLRILLEVTYEALLDAGKQFVSSQWIIINDTFRCKYHCCRRHAAVHGTEPQP